MTTHAPSSGASRLLLVGLIVAVSMTTIDQTIVALAAPTIQDSLGVGASAITWMVNAYLLATAAAFPTAGRLADLLGYRRVMLAGVGIFGAASVVCAATPAGEVATAFMIVSRVVQGIGAAAMFAAAVGILVSTASAERRASSMALFFGITGAMTALGPILGSTLIDTSWRLIFLINVPLAAVAAAMVARLAPSDQRRHERFDVAGAALAALAMSAAVVGLQRGADWGWTSPATIGAFLLALAAAAALVGVERRVAHPVIKIAVFRSRAFSLAALSSLLGAATFIPLMFFLSLYGQLALGEGLLITSALLGEFFGGFIVAAQVGARLFERRGLRPVLLLSGALGAAAFLWAAYGTSLPDAVAPMMLISAGASVGFMFSPSATDMVDRAIGASFGEITALSQSMKNLGGALGMAVLASISSQAFTSRLADGLATFGLDDATVASIATVADGDTAGLMAALATLPGQAQAEVVQVVRDSYAGATGVVLTAMAVVMAGLVVAALLYPRRARSAEPQAVTAEPADAVVPAA